MTSAQREQACEALRNRMRAEGYTFSAADRLVVKKALEATNDQAK